MPGITTDDGCRLHYELEGEAGRPLLLLSNSLGTALAMWDPQMPAFLEHFRVLRYDSRGHGRSAVPAGPYTIDRLGRDALAVVDAAGGGRFRFCGLSKGGMVGQWLGINAGDRVERLALCNTSSQIGAPEVWNERIATVKKDGMAAIVPGVIDRWFTKPFQERAPAAVEKIKAMLLATDPEGYTACAAAVRDMNQRAGLPSITTPTLVVAGRHDQATPVEHARIIAEAVPGARLLELDAAHLSNIEDEAVFTREVAAFLAG
jgi:3-oxoadipate enol-lactonase